jgi:hypothetical protein
MLCYLLGHPLIWYVDTTVSEEHAVSFFRLEVSGLRMRSNRILANFLAACLCEWTAPQPTSRLKKGTRLHGRGRPSASKPSLLSCIQKAAQPPTLLIFLLGIMRLKRDVNYSTSHTSEFRYEWSLQVYSPVNLHCIILQ